MSDALQKATERVQDHMDEILTLFKPDAKITVVIRFDDKPNADFCLSNDTLDQVAEAISRRMDADKPSPGNRTITGETVSGEAYDLPAIPIAHGSVAKGILEAAGIRIENGGKTIIVDGPELFIPHDSNTPPPFIDMGASRVFSEEQVTEAAKAMRSEALSFKAPVDLYVDGEAAERLGDDAWDRWSEDLTIESWRILVRAALSTIGSISSNPPAPQTQKACQECSSAISDLPRIIWIDPRDHSIHDHDGEGFVAYARSPSPKRHRHYKNDEDVAAIRDLSAQGLNQKQIAAKLAIHPRTVRKFVGGVYGQQPPAKHPSEVRDMMERQHNV